MGLLRCTILRQPIITGDAYKLPAGCPPTNGFQIARAPPDQLCIRSFTRPFIIPRTRNEPMKLGDISVDNSAWASRDFLVLVSTTAQPHINGTTSLQ